MVVVVVVVFAILVVTAAIAAPVLYRAPHRQRRSSHPRRSAPQRGSAGRAAVVFHRRANHAPHATHESRRTHPSCFPRPAARQPAVPEPRFTHTGGRRRAGRAGGWFGQVAPFGLKLDPLLSNLLRATESIASGRLRNRLPAVAAAGRPRGGETPPGLSSRRPARRGTRQSPPEPRAASLRSPDRSPVSLRRSPVSHGRSPRARTEDRRRPLAGDGHVRATVTCERDDDDDFEI
ncbi:unnamed protein product [Lampetra planeri]